MYFEIGLIISLSVFAAIVVHKGPFNFTKHFPSYWDLSGEEITFSDFLVITFGIVTFIAAGILVWPAVIVMLILYLIWFYTFRIRNSKLNK